MASGLLLPPTFVFGLLDRSGRLGWLPTRLWAWIVLVTGGVWRVRFRGLDTVRANPGAIVMSNHESLFDPVVMMALSNVPLRFLAKYELFCLPLLGWAMWSNRHVPVRRGDNHDARGCLRVASRLADEGDRLMIYPEGTRSPSSDLLPFKRGGFLIALRAGAPIIPVGIADTRNVCPRGWHWARRGPVSAVVGEPIDTRSYRRNCEALMECVRIRISQLRSEAMKLNRES